MSGAAEFYHDFDNDDDDDAMALGNEWLHHQEDKWHPYQGDGSDSPWEGDDGHSTRNKSEDALICKVITRGMFQGRDFGREVASPSLGGRPAIVNCMAQAP
jgi:hypothetical protein